MSSLLSLPTLLVLMFFPTTEEWVLFFCDPSRCTTQYTTSAFTSAKTKGMSYFSCRSPSLMALTGAGPQQKTPARERRCRHRPGFGHRGGKTLSWRGETLPGRDGAPARRTFALLLGCRVQRLPAIVAGCQVRTGHPGLYPAMEVPAREARTSGPQSLPVPAGLRGRAGEGTNAARGWAGRGPAVPLTRSCPWSAAPAPPSR